MLFRAPSEIDFEGYELAKKEWSEAYIDLNAQGLVPNELCSDNPQYMMAFRYGLTTWDKYFNPRQLITLTTYLKIIN